MFIYQENDMLRVAGASVLGSSHARSGQPNQDAIEAWLSEPGKSGAAVLAVADGHGGARHFRSHEGASLAVRTAIHVLREFIAGHNWETSQHSHREALTSSIPERIVKDWLAAVDGHLKDNPLTESELKAVETAEGSSAAESVRSQPSLAYGATLLAVVATESFIFSLQIGDGDTLVVDQKGQTMRPIPADTRLIANQTTSLCQPEAWKEFRTCLVDEPNNAPALIMVSTDGYSNSFRTEEDFLLIGRDYLDMVRERALRAVAEELPEILEEASAKGSGDDITLGILQRERQRNGTHQSATELKVEVRRVKVDYDNQAKKIQALESENAAQKKSMRQLRAIVATLLATALIALAAFYCRFQPPRGGSAPSHPERPGVRRPIASPAAPVDQLFLDVMSPGSTSRLTLNPGAVITRHQLNPADKDRTRVAEVKADASALYLNNLSAKSWNVTLGNGTVQRFRPGDQVPLVSGTTIDFGSIEATVHAGARVPRDLIK
jgi:serine/threonine protein phosphatase PrpC